MLHTRYRWVLTPVVLDTDGCYISSVRYGWMLHSLLVLDMDGY